MDSRSWTRANIFLNAGILCWVLALVAWCYGYDTIPFISLLFLFFIAHLLRERISVMFRKKIDNEAYSDNKSLPTVELEKNTLAADETSYSEDKSSNTVIASGGLFNGNINASGQIYVYGTIVGNIESKEGIVKIMHNGLVEGNIYSRELIIDGRVKGLCRAENIDIYENGCIEGSLAYAALSIKKGGVFTGQAERLSQTEKAVNVVDLKQEPHAQSADVEKSARSKKNS